ncbi:hypothetical protein LXA43DRAFT_1065157 [Ganoderma leucocontextum]|nr:hypothetical protein LXA43DRAFT_1065157 [Ganoderma leucocontextum]
MAASSTNLQVAATGMDGIPRLAVSIPLYISLPRHSVTRRKRYILVNANLERVGRNHSFGWQAHTLRQNLSADYNSISVDAIVAVNAGCRTGYSSEVALGRMVPEDERTQEHVDAVELDGARREFLADMTSRAESLGPCDSGGGSDDNSRCGFDVDVQRTRPVLSENMSRGMGESAVNFSVTDEHGSSVQCEGEQVPTVQEVEAVAGTTTGLKDEHCIDDMYA